LQLSIRFFHTRSTYGHDFDIKMIGRKQKIFEPINRKNVDFRPKFSKSPIGVMWTKTYDINVRLMQFSVTFGDIMVTWWHDMEHHKCSNQRDNMQAYVYMYISDENDKIKRFFVDFYRHLVFI